MAKQPRVFRGESLTDNATVAGTEEVIATLAGVVPADQSELVRLLGEAYWTNGVGTTTATLRVRRGSLTGAVVGEAEVVQAVASQGGGATIAVQEAPGEGSFTYVLTIAIAGAASTVNIASLLALVG